MVAFWWSPDGETIAALRLQPADVEASTGGNEARLLFVDAQTGDIGSQTAVVPGRLFITQLLTYFDQYALSHQLWSPDSATFLMPITTSDGATRIAVLPRDGSDPDPHRRPGRLLEPANGLIADGESARSAQRTSSG